MLVNIGQIEHETPIEYRHGMYPSSSLRGRVKNFRKVFTGGGEGSAIFILVWEASIVVEEYFLWRGRNGVGGGGGCSWNFKGKFQIE